MSKILLLGSQHGNEILGEKLYDYIVESGPDIASQITFMVGNIRAHKQRIRQIESDLNRSYTGGSETYEERRATRILRYIRKERFDLVLDLHTTTCAQPPCIIVPGINSDNRQFLRASTIDNIILMPQTFAATSLIGVYLKAVSIEVDENTLDSKLMKQLVGDIGCYICGANSKTKRNIFQIDDLLNKGELPDAAIKELRNFEYSKFGFYPLLVGEESYKEYTSYLGFKAHKMLENRL